MLLPPLPNFIFQRDPSCWIFDGVTINPMTKPARKPETMVMEAIYRFHPMFTSEKFQIWLGGADEDWGRAHVEGGDVQPIGNGAVMIGMGERTTPQAVLWIARSLFRPWWQVRGSGPSGRGTTPTTSSSRRPTGPCPRSWAPRSGSGTCGSSRPVETASGPSASSGTTATTSS